VAHIASLLSLPPIRWLTFWTFVLDLALGALVLQGQQGFFAKGGEAQYWSHHCCQLAGFEELLLTGWSFLPGRN